MGPPRPPRDDGEYERTPTGAFRMPDGELVSLRDMVVRNDARQTRLESDVDRLGASMRSLSDEAAVRRGGETARTALRDWARPIFTTLVGTIITWIVMHLSKGAP